LLIFAFGIAAGFFLNQQLKNRLVKAPKPQDKYLAFSLEVYDLIKENYFDFILDDQLVNLYALGIEKISGEPQEFEARNREELETKLEKIIEKASSDEAKKEFVTQLADMVLVNLQPFGRSRLYTQKETQDLQKNVKNISETDHYGVLGIKKNDSQETIKQAYDQINQILEPQAKESSEAAQKLSQVNQAYEVLKDKQAREIYDQSGVETTVRYRVIPPDMLHLQIIKMSPTTFDDIKRAADNVDDQEYLDTLILDLRDNVGGLIDGLPYFLGPFIGQNQYAYQFLHQGTTTDFKTKTGWLPSLIRYKKVVVLINQNSQSSAEVMAATLKRYNVGVVIGTTTKGWGTVEKVFKLNQQLDSNQTYSVFLAHSLTLRNDGQPIQDNGINPIINIEDSNWEQQLLAYFNQPELIKAIKEIWDFKP